MSKKNVARVTPYVHRTRTKPVMIDAGLLDGTAVCHRGHTVDEDNVIVWKSAANSRRCRECYKIKRREQAARRKAARAAERELQAAKAERRVIAARKAAATRKARKLAAAA